MQCLSISFRVWHGVCLFLNNLGERMPVTDLLQDLMNQHQLIIFSQLQFLLKKVRGNCPWSHGGQIIRSINLIDQKDLMYPKMFSKHVSLMMVNFTLCQIGRYRQAKLMKFPIFRVNKDIASWTFHTPHQLFPNDFLSGWRWSCQLKAFKNKNHTSSTKELSILGISFDLKDLMGDSEILAFRQLWT